MPVHGCYGAVDAAIGFASLAWVPSTHREAFGLMKTFARLRDDGFDFGVR